MDIEKVKSAQSRDEAYDYAIQWIHWVSEQSLSYGEMAEWNHVFEILAHRFDLVEEFIENGII